MSARPNLMPDCRLSVECLNGGERANLRWITGVADSQEDKLVYCSEPRDRRARSCTKAQITLAAIDSRAQSGARHAGADFCIGTTRSGTDSARLRACRCGTGRLDLASELVASGVTTQPVATVMTVLTAMRDGASTNAAARASGINYRTAQRIVQAASKHRQGRLAVVS
jgi:hypothetical protein